MRGTRRFLTLLPLLVLIALANQAVTASDSAFYSGAGDRSGVKVQLKISGVSLAVSPDNYSTSIVFTVVDIW